uniref:Uncharacterized protein n=1 Tax=Oryza punctata TaxID=4537 RepID=A0A0E0K8D4_ORYPU
MGFVVFLVVKPLEPLDVKDGGVGDLVVEDAIGEVHALKPLDGLVDLAAAIGGGDEGGVSDAVDKDNEGEHVEGKALGLVPLAGSPEGLEGDIEEDGVKAGRYRGGHGAKRGGRGTCARRGGGWSATARMHNATPSRIEREGMERVVAERGLVGGACVRNSRDDERLELFLMTVDIIDPPGGRGSFHQSRSIPSNHHEKEANIFRKLVKMRE